MICSRPPVRKTNTKLPLSIFYNVLYVGRSNNLKERFNQHTTNPQRDIKKICKIYKDLEFWYIQTPINRIDEVESKLISALNPIGNRIKASRRKESEPIQGYIVD